MRTAGRKNKPFFDDLARAAAGALGSVSELRSHLKKLVRETVDQIAEDMDLVSREELERVAATAEKARTRQLELEKRIAALEKKLTGKAPAQKRKGKA